MDGPDKRGRLNIRPELALRPLLFVTERCPTELLKIRGREETKKWSRNWQLLNKLGTQPDGSMINLLRCKVTSVRVCARSFPKEILRQGGIMRILRMVELKARCQEHNGFAELFSVVEDEYGVTMFYEPERTDLYNFYIDKKDMTEKYAVQKIIQPLVETVEYMHNEQGVVHRNLTAESVVIDYDGRVKIGDFSLALCLNDQQPSSVVGKLPYMAPELLHLLVMQKMRGNDDLPPNPYDERIDIWSLGVLVYEIFMSREPFYGRDAESLLDSIDRYAMFNTPKAAKLSEECRNFIKFLLQPEPSDRPSATEILEHPFILNNQEVPRVTAVEKARTATKKLLSAAAAISFRDRAGSTGGSSTGLGGTSDRKTPTSSRFGMFASQDLGLDLDEQDAMEGTPTKDSKAESSSGRRPMLQGQRSLLQMFVVRDKKKSSTPPPELHTVEEGDEQKAFRKTTDNAPGETTRRSTNSVPLPPPMAPASLPAHLTVEEHPDGDGEDAVLHQDQVGVGLVADDAASSAARRDGVVTVEALPPPASQKTAAGKPALFEDEAPNESPAPIAPRSPFLSQATSQKATPVVGRSPLQSKNGVGPESIGTRSPALSKQGSRIGGDLRAMTPARAPSLKRQTSVRTKEDEPKVVCGCFSVKPKAKPQVKYEVE